MRKVSRNFPDFQGTVRLLAREGPQFGFFATVAIDAMAFLTPVHVGAVVSCYCDVLEIGRSSIRIVVEVWINSKHDGEPIKVTEGEFVFVAIDDNGRTRAIQN